METINKLVILGLFLAIVFAGYFAFLPIVQAQYYGNCTYHAYKLCQGNSIYWYDSCDNQQDLYFACNNGQTCQFGQCVAFAQNYNVPVSNYVAYYKTACSGGSVYWFDSLGIASGLYKNCQDVNSCTIDSCSQGKCLNTTKCDGSSCEIGSDDYNTYCATSPLDNPKHCGNELCEPSLGETTANCASDCKIIASTNTNSAGLAILFFTKQNSSSNQWQKTAQIGPNSQVYFMISATNSSAVQIDNINVSANIPAEISSLGNLQLNGVPLSGDIVSGVNIGSIAAAGVKTVTFEGKTQAISTSAVKQATATSNVSSVTQSDSVSINLAPDKTPTAAVASSVSETPGFWGFLQKWYLWILGAVVLVFLFVIVFRRLSSNT